MRKYNVRYPIFVTMHDKKNDEHKKQVLIHDSTVEVEDLQMSDVDHCASVNSSGNAYNVIFYDGAYFKGGELDRKEGSEDNNDSHRDTEISNLISENYRSAYITVNDLFSHEIMKHADHKTVRKVFGYVDVENVRKRYFATGSLLRPTIDFEAVKKLHNKPTRNKLVDEIEIQFWEQAAQKISGAIKVIDGNVYTQCHAPFYYVTSYNGKSDDVSLAGFGKSGEQLRLLNIERFGDYDRNYNVKASANEKYASPLAKEINIQAKDKNITTLIPELLPTQQSLDELEFKHKFHHALSVFDAVMDVPLHLYTDELIVKLKRIHAFVKSDIAPICDSVIEQADIDTLMNKGAQLITLTEDGFAKFMDRIGQSPVAGGKLRATIEKFQKSFAAFQEIHSRVCNHNIMISQLRI